MNKPRLSLICPTRDRTANIQRLIENIVNTVHNIENIELLFACDSDDATSMYFINQQRNKYPTFNIRYYYRERSEWLNRDYYNWLTEKATGEFCWLMGDDLIFAINQWDRIVLDALDNFLKDKKDRIAYVNVQSDTPNPPGIDYKFSGFPVISKEAINTLGFFMIPELPSWCGDYLLPLLYGNDKVNRMINIEKVILSHISSHTQKVLGDNITYRLGLICNKYNSPKIADAWKKEKLNPCIDLLVTHIAIKQETDKQKHSRQDQDRIQWEQERALRDSQRTLWMTKINDIKKRKARHINLITYELVNLRHELVEIKRITDTDERRDKTGLAERNIKYIEDFGTNLSNLFEAEIKVWEEKLLTLKTEDKKYG